MVDFQVMLKGFSWILFFVFSSGALSAEKCVQPDGSVTYSQFGCDETAQKREDVRFWDSDEKSYRPEAEKELNEREIEREREAKRELASDANERKSEKSKKETDYSDTHPCMSESRSPVQARLEREACAVLNRPYNENAEACRKLESGDALGGSVPEYKAVIQECKAMSGQDLDRR